RGRVEDAEGMGMPGVNVVIKGTSVGTVTDAEGYYSLTLTGDARTLVFSFVGYTAQEIPLNNQPVVDVSMVEEVSMLGEVVVTAYGVQQSRSITGSVSSISGRAAGMAPRVKRTITATPVVRQTNVEFTLDEPFTVKSDGELRTTDMVAYDLPAIFEYYCVPKLDNDAFLLAKVLSWDEYNFLEGEASLFFEGKYIGKSIMDTRNTNDTLTLSLGRDANVLVTRDKIKDLSSRQLAGSNQHVTYGYEIVVRNKKSQPVTIVIDDQVPVPNTKEITVDLLEDSHGDYHADTGILNWRKQLAPGKTETIRMKYVVRYPKSSQMILE
ncbi:MAG TPA: mucoidy inhibitor MuiA family protein, partial [Ohtaekwangia sp.]|nr:mucoidy inhibitor MuiA family protein [Ohtaekwangia sp.]